MTHLANPNVRFGSEAAAETYGLRVTAMRSEAATQMWVSKFRG
jgi:hypothetical protein